MENEIYPLSWERVCEIVKFYNTHTKEEIVQYGNRFARNPVVEQKYKLHRTANKKTQSPDYFFPNGESYVFTLNRFPYWVEDNISHCICWFNPTKYNTDSELPKVSDYTNYLHVCFENIKEWRSVPHIRHIHIFFTKKTKKTLTPK